MADVALITSSFLPRIGGVEEHVRSVAARLRERGIDVVVWTVDQGDDVPPVVDGVPVRVLPCPLPARSLHSLLSFAWQGPVAGIRWALAVAQDRPAILHVHCFGPNGVWAMAAAIGRRLVVTSHGESTGDATGALASSALLRWALRRALTRADLVTAVAPSVADDLVARFGLREGTAQIIANGVDLDEAPGRRPPSLPARYVLGIGRLVDTKGFDLLLNAFASARLPDDVGIVIAGDGIERSGLSEQAARLGISGRVVFTGALDRGQIVTVAVGAALLAVPSRVEAFGIVVLEGWRAGVPVIATNRGGPADLINDGVDGLLVDPVDRAGFASALERVFADPVLARRIGSAGRARAAEYSWNAVVSSYSAAYASLRSPGRADTIAP